MTPPRAPVRRALTLCAALALLASGPPDSSLTTAEYVRRGVPPLDHPWSEAEVEQAIRVLLPLHGTVYRADELAELPRYQSRRSGELFARLTAAPVLDRTGSFDDRLAAAKKAFLSRQELLDAYKEALRLPCVRGIDTVEMRAGVLRSLVAAMPLADEQEPLDQSNFRQFRPSLQALVPLGEVLGAMISRTEITSEEPYQTDEVARLVEILREALPEILPRLDTDSRASMIGALREEEASPRLADLAADVHRLREEAEAVLAHVPPPQPPLKERDD